MKRNFIWTLGIVSVLSFVSCGSDSPDKTLQKYLNFEKSCDYSSAYELLSESDKNTKSLEEYIEDIIIKQNLFLQNGKKGQLK